MRPENPGLCRGFTFEFEELPIVAEEDREGGGISGEAEIEYFDNGEWTIAGTAVSAWTRRGHCEVPRQARPITLPRWHVLHALIVTALSERRSEEIEEAVRQHMAMDDGSDELRDDKNWRAA